VTLPRTKHPDAYYFENLGQDFDRFMSSYDVERRIRLIFDQLLHQVPLPENPAVLEIGCGTGKISKRLRQITESLSVNDISPKLTADVAQRLHCVALAGDCANLPAGEETFDLIVSSECIEHTPHPYTALAEMRRVLKKGGWLIITTPNKLWCPVLWAAQLLKIRKFCGIETWTWPLKTKKWLRDAEFENIRFSGCHLWPWQIPLSKRILPCFDRYGEVLYPVMINYGVRAQKKK